MEGEGSDVAGHDAAFELQAVGLQVDAADVEIVPIDAALRVFLSGGVILHGKTHVLDFDLVDVEDLLFVDLRFFAFLQAEDAGEAVRKDVPVAFDRFALDDKVHLGVGDVCAVEVDAVSAYETLEGELGDDVLGAEECVDLDEC